MIAQFLLDALPLGALVTDRELNLLQVNRWLVDRLSPDQLARVSEPLGTVFPELAEHSLLAAYQLVLQTGQKLTLPTSVHRSLVRLPAPAGAGLDEMAQATTIVPLYDQGQLSGTLTLIQDISQGLAAERHLQREIDRLSALHEIDRALNTLDLRACLAAIAERTHTLFGAAYTALLLREGGRLVVAAGAGLPGAALGQVVPPETGVVEWVAARKRAVRLPDGAADFRFASPNAGTRSEMAAPLMVGGECIGVLNVESGEPNAFSQDDLEVLEMAAARAAVAIHNARLHAAERDHRELATTLTEIGLRLAAELDPEAILDTLLDHVRRVVPYDSASVLMLDANGKRVTVERMRGYEAFGVSQLALHFQQDLQELKNLARMAETGRPYTLPDTATSTEWVHQPVAAHIRSWAGAPIVARGAVLGFLSLDKVEAGFYTEALADRLAAFAAQAGLALENARLYAEQQRLAVTDGLTGVANRRQFDHLLAHELHRASRFHRPTALIMLDLDDFKPYNDRYGHLAGDELLRALALVLTQCLRTTDTLARYGGEEFAVILPETDLTAAYQIAERLRGLIEHLPLRPNGAGDRSVTLSLGVSVAPQHALTPHGLVNAADMALYQAKAQGKNLTVVYEVAPIAER